MPIWDNNGLDDQPVFDASTDFRGGLNTTVLPHLLAPNEYAQGLNINLTKTGRPQTRGGTDVKGDMTSAVMVRGTCYYETTSDEEVVVLCDNDMKVWDNTTFSAVSGYDLTGQVSAFQGQTMVWIFGDGGSKYYDGTNLRNVNHLALPTISAAGTGYVAGDVLTTTGGTPETAGQIRVKTVGGSGEITEIEFTSVTNRGRGFASAPGPTDHSGGTGSGAEFTFTLTTPTVGNIAAWHTERVFKNDTANPDTLLVSDILEPHYYPTANSLTIGSDGEPITGLVSWDNFNLLVLKANSAYVVEANPTVALASWTIHKISSTVGCVSHKSAVQVGKDVWWMSREGVVSAGRLIQETQREITNAISAPIQDYVDRITWGSVSQANAAYFDNKYLISIPVDSATEPNTLLVYDTYHQRWVGEWDGFNVAGMVRSKFGDKSELYFGTDDGELRLYRPDTTQDTDGVASTDIVTTLDLRAFIFQEVVSPKHLLNVRLEFQEATATIDVKVSLDDRDFEDIATGVESFRELLTLPFTLPATLSDGGNFRKAYSLLQHRRIHQAQIRLTSTAGRMSLRSCVMSAFIEPLEIVA